MVINQCAHNKGDRAVLHFVAQELARNGVSRVTVSTSDRTLWRGAHFESNIGVEFAPWGWNVESNRGLARDKQSRMRSVLFRRVAYPALRALLAAPVRFSPLARWLCNPEFYRGLKRADLVISTGGHHVTTLLAPDAVSPQLFDMGIALLVADKLALWSQSIGPLDFTDRKNEDFVRAILHRACWISVRDEQSLHELRQMGVQHERMRRTFESVIGMHGAVGPYVPPSSRQPILGIAVYTVKKRSQGEHRAYVGSLAEFVRHAAVKGYRPHFFPMQVKGHPADDRPVIRDIVRATGIGSRCLVHEKDAGFLDHLTEIARCRVFLGHKTHSIVFALTTATPVLAVAYHPKASDFMTNYGLARYCIPDDVLSAKRLISAFDDVCRNLDEIGRTQHEKSRAFAESVRSHFAEMLLEAGAPSHAKPPEVHHT